MNKNVPKLRFQGFDEEWEEKRLNELYIKSGSGGTPKSTNKSYYEGNIPFLGISDISKSNGTINDTEKHISEEGLRNSTAWIVPSGAISLAMYASVGKLAILNNNIATSQAFYNMIFSDHKLRDFVYQRLSKATEIGEWNKLISTGTQSNLNAEKVKLFPIKVPNSENELSMISSFFKTLDQVISLQEKKIALLKEQKKGFLQKLFPKAGAKVPELRFAEFEEDWEELHLERVFSQTVSYVDPKKEGLELWSVTVSDGLVPKTERYNREFLVKKTDKFKLIHPGEIVYNPMNMTLGSVGFNTSGKDVAVSGYYVTMKLKEGFDSSYFGTWLPSYNAISLYKIYATGSLIERQRIQFPTLAEIKTFVPSQREQKLVGLLFNRLDNNLVFNYRKLDNLKEQKKGLLQMMFI